MIGNTTTKAKQENAPRSLIGQKTCALAGCGKPFEPKRYWQRFCSPECKKAKDSVEMKQARRIVKEQRAKTNG